MKRAAGLALVATVVAWALVGGAGRPLDRALSDRFFGWRYHLGLAPAPDPEVVVIAVDEATYRSLDKPLALWLPEFAQVSQAVLAAGATALAFDIIPSYAPPDQFLPLGKVLLAHPGKVFMATFLDRGEQGQPDRLVTPAPEIAAVLGQENLGLSNLTRDDDGVARRLRTAALDFEGQGYPFLSVLLQRVRSGPEPPRELLIDYVAPPRQGPPTYSMAEVLAWAESAQDPKLEKAFQGKLVLLGSTAKADLDLVDTPIGASMPGIEVHAHLLNSMAHPQRLVPASEAWTGVALLLLCSLALYPALQVKLSWSWLPPTVAAILWVGGAFAFFCAGYLASPALGPAALSLGLLGAYGYRSLYEERQRRHLKQVFGRYVCPEVMEEMLQFPDDHRPEEARRQRVTVMFSDINNFSTHCEQLDPEEVTRRLNNYFTEMSDILFRHRGTIIRFIGDEFMVLFGAPRQTENPEQAAVEAGLEMLQRLRELKAGDPEGRNGFYEVKIGVHVGDLILTSIGSGQRSDYNCIGDSANTAARVLSLTKPTNSELLVSQDVVDALTAREELEIEEKGVHPVKGRRREVCVYEIRRA